MSNYTECSLMILYITGGCSDKERKEFEKHLPHCPSCPSELTQIQSIWDTLPWQIDTVRAPEDLKVELFEHIEAEQQAAKTNFLWNAKKFLLRRKISIITVCIGLALIFSMIWGRHLLVDRIHNTQIAFNRPAQVVETYNLIAFDPKMPKAKGKAWIVSNGGSKRIVLNLYGLKQTKGPEAYQLWVIKNGKKYNGGTFKVDPKGSGVLVHQLLQKEVPFDVLGITLEPNSNGSKPRGTKVLGTVQQKK